MVNTAPCDHIVHTYQYSTTGQNTYCWMYSGLHPHYLLEPSSKPEKISKAYSPHRQTKDQCRQRRARPFSRRYPTASLSILDPTPMRFSSSSRSNPPAHSIALLFESGAEDFEPVSGTFEEVNNTSLFCGPITQSLVPRFCLVTGFWSNPDASGFRCLASKETASSSVSTQERTSVAEVKFSRCLTFPFLRWVAHISSERLVPVR